MNGRAGRLRLRATQLICDAISIGNSHQLVAVELHVVERVDEDVAADDLADLSRIRLYVNVDASTLARCQDERIEGRSEIQQNGG